MSILVTGGTGYIGSHTVVELLNIGEEVIIVDNLSNSKLCVLDRIEKITGKRPEFIKCDLLDMQKLGLVSTVTIEGRLRYDITKKGHETLQMFRDKIPGSVRDKIYKLAEKHLALLERGREIVADIQPIDEKKFLAKCGIYEFGMPLMELSIFAGSRKHAEEIAKNFEKQAATLYKTILETIIE